MVAAVALQVEHERRDDDDDRDLAELDAEGVAEQRRDQIAGRRLERVERGREAEAVDQAEARRDLPAVALEAADHGLGGDHGDRQRDQRLDQLGRRGGGGRTTWSADSARVIEWPSVKPLTMPRRRTRLPPASISATRNRMWSMPSGSFQPPAPRHWLGAAPMCSMPVATNAAKPSAGGAGSSSDGPPWSRIATRSSRASRALTRIWKVGETRAARTNGKSQRIARGGAGQAASPVMLAV